jgi:hypothetical protein
MRPLRTLALAVAIAAVTATAADALPIGVPAANPRVGHPANKIVPGYQLDAIVNGTDPLENPSGPITNYGFLNTAPP